MRAQLPRPDDEAGLKDVLTGAPAARFEGAPAAAPGPAPAPPAAGAPVVIDPAMQEQLRMTTERARRQLEALVRDLREAEQEMQTGQ